MKNIGTLVPSVALALAIGAAAAPAIAQDTDTPVTEDVIVVRGALVPEEKRATSEISSLLDAEDFDRTGDSDIAAALRRVAGISIVDGKFPVARGLNERYSSATLNGVPLPSPEPLRRAAPLDLVPTQILAGSLAQKTFSPELSGEFGGAAIDLQTISVPDENFLSISVGVGIDTETTFADGFFYDGGDTDFLGFDDGTRDLPDAADVFVRDPSLVRQDVLDLSFEQEDTLLISDGETPANGSVSVVLGRVLADKADYRIGTSTFVGYTNDWQRRDVFFDRTDANDDATIQEDFVETRQEVGLSALNTTGIEFGGGDHELNLTSFILRNTLKRARVGTAIDEDVTQFTQLVEFTDFIERSVWQFQLSGDHLFPDLFDLEAAWRVAYGEANRDAPYERRVARDIRDANTTQLRIGTRQGTSLNFSELNDENFYAGVDFTVPFPLFSGESEFAFGGAYTDNSRSILRRDFDVVGTAGTGSVQNGAALLQSRPDLIFSDTVLATSLIDYDPDAAPLFPDASDASIEIMAAYAKLDLELNDYLRASVGFRFEDSEQESSTLFTGDATSLSSFPALDESYFLPAVTVTWNPLGNLQVRGAYSQTVTRPQFRELVPTDFLDPNLDVTLRGNPFLVNSEIDNYDIRAEYYFSRGQFVTVGVFYKDIMNPIEQFFVGNEGSTTGFLNAPEAEIFGVEAEFEKRFALDEMFDGDFWYAKELVFVTNYTYSDSEVKAADGDSVIIAQAGAQGIEPRVRPATDVVIDGRSLQGQSDHLFNLQIGIENIDTGTKVTGLLNYASERTLLVPGNDALAAAVIEEPPITLDLVLSQNVDLFGAEYGLGVKVQNILGDDFSAFRELNGTDVPFFEYDLGTRFSVSLSRDF